MGVYISALATHNPASALTYAPRRSTIGSRKPFPGHTSIIRRLLYEAYIGSFHLHSADHGCGLRANGAAQTRTRTQEARLLSRCLDLGRRGLIVLHPAGANGWTAGSSSSSALTLRAAPWATAPEPPTWATIPRKRSTPTTRSVAWERTFTPRAPSMATPGTG